MRVVPEITGSSLLESRVDSGLEIRRILLLTRLRDVSKGMTMAQLVKDCGKVSGWNIPGKTEELADNMFWKEIYDVFDKAYRRLRPKSQTPAKGSVDSGRFAKGVA